jgi:hypothetical protein
MKLAWKAERDALATVRRFNARLSKGQKRTLFYAMRQRFSGDMCLIRNV